MKKTFFWILFLLINTLGYGQQDSIYLYAKIHSNLRTVDVEQTLQLHSNTIDSNKIELLNWINAYKSKGTKLAKRNLENNKKDLHFAKNDELGKISTIKVNIADSSFVIKNSSQENITIPLPSFLKDKETITIHLSYQLQLPSSKFTGYGYTTNKEVLLKYFFLVPDRFKNFNPKKKSFQNIEETAHFGDYWKVDLEVPTHFYSKSNLNEITPHSFEGRLNEDTEFLISSTNYPRINTNVNGQSVEVDFGYSIDSEKLSHLEFFIPLQLQYIKESTGVLPSKIFISNKFQKQENFFGNDDVQFWKFKFPLFTLKENIDLDYFSILSKKVLQQSTISFKEDHHNIINGIKTYLEIEYLKKHYANKRLLGDLPDISIYGMQPLKWFHASKMKLLERYNLGYRYVMTRNLDQKINEDYTELSNLNHLTISHFESGRLLHYISEKTGKEEFNNFLTRYIQEYQNKPLDKKAFINAMHEISKGEFAFLEDFVNKKHRVNFNLKMASTDETSTSVIIQHNLPLSTPFTVETFDEIGKKEIHWLKTKSDKGKDSFTLPSKLTKKIIVNNSMYLPERNYRDNYLYPNSFLSNLKKVKFSLFNDIENPEYNEIYLNPRLGFNAYDKVLLGLNFSNRSFLDKSFNYSLTPYFSTGTKKMTGSGSLIYRIMPADYFLQKINIGVSGSYFHYDYNNTYKKATIFSSFLLRKKARSTINQQFNLSYNHFNKEIPQDVDIDKTYERYNLFNFNYSFIDNKLIHEKSFGISYQTMEDFDKVSAEAFYRYEFAPNKKLSIRWFGGYFLRNTTKNNAFDFGISRINNYGFNYGLLGQSATSGWLSQQYILADGGFKSYLGLSANQWITSLNSDITVWKMIHLYGDAGCYKNKNINPKFIWDSGVNLRLIPDFLELYFPMYSNLGFEPTLNNYHTRIRFKLVFEISSISRILRRGWY